MAPFSTDDTEQLDFWLFRDGATSLFAQADHFEAAQRELERLGYAVHRLELASDEAMHRSLGTTLRFEENFGYTPTTVGGDALVDALREIRFDGVTGVAFALADFDALHARDARYAQILADELECASRDHLVFGDRVLSLVQTSRRHLGALGARGASDHHVLWWFRANRP